MESNLVPGILVGVVTAIFSAWYFFGESKPKRDPFARVASPPVNKKLVVKKAAAVRFLFGSQTGTAEDFCRKLVAEGKAHGLDVELCDLEEYKIDDLKDAKILVVVAATYGEGDPTDNAKDFLEDLCDENQPADLLENVQFTVFGLGNKTYEHYNKVGRLFNERMEQLGAKRIYQYGEGDDDASLEDDFAAWKKGLFAPLCNFFGIDPEVVVEDTQTRRYKIAFHENESKEFYIAKKNESGFLFKKSDSKTYDAKNPFLGRVLVNRELHSSKSDRSCRHIEIEISKDCKYEAGDHIGIVPENTPQIVEAAAKRLGVSLDSTFTLYEGEKKTIALGPCTVRHALTQWCDLTNIPRKSFLKVLSQYASEESSDKYLKERGFASEKEHLLALSNDSNAQPYSDFIKENHRSILEVLQYFSTVNIPFDHFVEVVPRLPARYYSISSSPKEKEGTVHVTAMVVRFVSPTGRVHDGVCSNWLTHQVPNGDKLPVVPVFFQKANFHLPKDPKVPVVMVGPGTGLAPFRGFIQERKKLFQQGTTTKNLFFFGCRANDVDYIYQEELLEAQKDGYLDLHVAFSRQGPQKVYVQHLMKNHEDEIWKLLGEEKGYFYVCGDARNMAKDVHNTLHQIVKNKLGVNDEEAEKYLTDMQTSGRYLSDTWF